MKMFFVLLVTSILGVCLVGACGGGGGEPAPFSMQVIPDHMEDTIAGQRCVFLTTVEDIGEGSGQGNAVSVSATAPGSMVTVAPQMITPGQVAEVTVIPDEASTGETLTVKVHGEREGLKQTETVTLLVQEGIWDPAGLAGTAAEMRDAFIPWLAANHPELGITSETEWSPTIVLPHIMVVMYYLFFSEDWEMGVRWHVMIPPHDWAEIYLRHRTTEVHPSYGFKISSLDAQDEPHAVDLQESVWR